MKLTNAQIQLLHNALTRLEPADKPGFVFSGKVRYNIARNLRLLRTVLEEVEAMRVKLVKERLPSGASELTGPERADFEGHFSEILQTETELALYTVTIAELDLDKNQIPLLLLAELVDKMIIEDNAALPRCQPAAVP
jgi:hypothetical protein